MRNLFHLVYDAMFWAWYLYFMSLLPKPKPENHFFLPVIKIILDDVVISRIRSKSVKGQTDWMASIICASQPRWRFYGFDREKNKILKLNSDGNKMNENYHIK